MHQDRKIRLYFHITKLVAIVVKVAQSKEKIKEIMKRSRSFIAVSEACRLCSNGPRPSSRGQELEHVRTWVQGDPDYFGGLV